MKVLMTADTVGGVWTYALELSAALHSHDVHVILATMGPQPRDVQRASAEAIPHLRLQVTGCSGLQNAKPSTSCTSTATRTRRCPGTDRS
jgi:hypothetical protein